MPAGDGTGPMGMGPRTGRAAGYCSGYSAPGYANPGPGRGGGFYGAGRGAFGRGRGHRHWYHATGLPFWGRGAAQSPAPAAAPYYPTQTMTPDQELAYMKNQAEYLTSSLEDIQKRISELEAKSE